MENLYHTSFEDLVKKFFGSKYKMIDTKKVLSQHEIDRYVTGYDERGFAVPYFAQYTGALGPELASTLKDMLTYMSINLSNNSIFQLSHESTYAHSNLDEKIALGWMLSKNWFKDHIIYHTGAGFGGHSACYMIPAKKLGIVIFVNEKISQDRVNALVTGLQEIFY